MQQSPWKASSKRCTLKSIFFSLATRSKVLKVKPYRSKLTYLLLGSNTFLQANRKYTHIYWSWLAAESYGLLENLVITPDYIRNSGNHPRFPQSFWQDDCSQLTCQKSIYIDDTWQVHTVHSAWVRTINNTTEWRTMSTYIVYRFLQAEAKTKYWQHGQTNNCPKSSLKTKLRATAVTMHPCLSLCKSNHLLRNQWFKSSSLAQDILNL